jgi:outer membrane protein assembly factor BamB
VNTANGQQLWSWAAPALPEVMGITTGRAAAGLGIVLVATGKLNRAPASSGTAPANPGGVVSSPPAEFELVDHLTALNAGTGQRLWNLSLPADGQTVPAALADGNVIVTEADGTVIALDARTGARRWTDGLPPGCRSNDPIAPMAQIVSSAASLTVLYPCAKASQVAALSPGTGATQWTWTAPRAWSVNQPVAAVTTEDVTTEGVTAFLVSGPGTAAPQRASWTLGPSAAGGPNQVVAVDDSTGRPLWELNDVDASASLYAGAGEICADSSYGAECLDARTGTESWQWRPAIVPIPSQEPGPLLGGAAVGHGDLYVIAPTPAAAKIDSSSTTQQSAPGTFDLRLMSLATGRVLASQPLPAYYGGGNGTVVSLGSPPGVAAVSGHLALVTPQASETEVIEALTPNAS